MVFRTHYTESFFCPPPGAITRPHTADAAQLCTRVNSSAPVVSEVLRTFGSDGSEFHAPSEPKQTDWRAYCAKCDMP